MDYIFHKKSRGEIPHIHKNILRVFILNKKADDNASQNIKQRLVSTVLRNEPLKKNPIGNNAFLPKALKKDHVKNILLSCRSRVYKLKEVNKVS